MNKKTKVLAILGGILLVSLLYLAGFSTPTTLGSAPSGLPASNASTSQIAVTNGTVTTPVATSTACSARIVATASTTVMIHIGDAHPSATRGYFMAASTTQIFDGGIYGCGALKVYPFQTGAITVTATN